MTTDQKKDIAFVVNGMRKAYNDGTLREEFFDMKDLIKGYERKCMATHRYRIPK